MESIWSPHTSSTKRPSRPAVSLDARGRARCCRWRKSAVTAGNGVINRAPASPELPDDLLGERVERVPVVRALAEGDVEAGAAGVAEGRDHVHGLLGGAPQPARALGAEGAPVLLEDLLPARRPYGVGAQVEAEVDGSQDRLGVAPFL